MDMGLSGKVAAVCGASTGIGYACAESLAREGALVSLCARNESRLVEAAQKIHQETGSKTAAIQADISDFQQSKFFIEETQRQLGAPTVLVINAGGPPAGEFSNISGQQWQKAVETNFLSAVPLIQAVLPQMKEARWGRIIAITSMAVKQPMAGLILSNAVRAGLTGLLRTLAGEVGAWNITVNGVLPGFTNTQRLESLAGRLSEIQGKTVAEIRKGWDAQGVLGRIGKVEEIASAVTFLASEPAAFITGVSLAVDGGAAKNLF